MKYVKINIFFLGMPVWLLLVTLSWAIHYAANGPGESWTDFYRWFREMLIG